MQRYDLPIGYALVIPCGCAFEVDKVEDVTLAYFCGHHAALEEEMPTYELPDGEPNPAFAEFLFQTSPV